MSNFIRNAVATAAIAALTVAKSFGQNQTDTTLRVAPELLPALGGNVSIMQGLNSQKQRWFMLMYKNKKDQFHLHGIDDGNGVVETHDVDVFRHYPHKSIGMSYEEGRRRADDGFDVHKVVTTTVPVPSKHRSPLDLSPGGTSFLYRQENGPDSIRGDVLTNGTFDQFLQGMTRVETTPAAPRAKPILPQ